MKDIELNYRLIEDGNGWYIIQSSSREDREWKEFKNYYGWLDKAETDFSSLKVEDRKRKLNRVVIRVIEEYTCD